MRLLLILLSSIIASAQTLTPRPATPPQITLDLIAHTPTRPQLTLPDLTLQDGQLKIPIFPTHQSAQLLFVLDAINSAPSDLARSTDALRAYLSTSSPLPQPTTILIVSDAQPRQAPDPRQTATLSPRELYVHRIPPTTDAATLLRALKDYQPRISPGLNSQAGATQPDRVRLSLQALSFIAQAQISIPGPKLVLWLGPGWPFLASANAKSSTQLFDSVVYFSSPVRTARILLYSLNPLGLTSQDHSAQTEAFLLATRPGAIGPASHPSVPTFQDPDFYTNFLTLPRDPRHADPNDLSLQVLAVQTGGLVIQQDNDLPAALVRCAADAQSVFSFTYTPPPSQPATTQYHDLHLASPRGLPLRLRPSFYTP